MLELKNIIKDYPAGNGNVRALRGLDLKFRESEFVSILGPSGCGKTTLLNIIGGLDQYTSGDMLIDGVSTKEYKNRDWDTYRNHSIGFVFQSYNLIMHQSVLQNVEIALTVSGVSKQKRRAMAKQALIDVGLGDQFNKRPNQLSGGQMQRVAIARALVNNPKIILADEPTGALDTQTSVQVMEILKEISKDRLIIMVTHNPDLAQQYSSRIINMLDGEITNDSAPIDQDEYTAIKQHEQEQKEKNRKIKKPSMSFFTAFKLSLKNLFTKKGRTTLTAFAGSIGIMGIALILAVSQGTTAYINAVQEDSLSSYPLTIEKTTIDMSQLMETFMSVNNPDAQHGNDAVYKKSAIYDMLTAWNNIESSENDLESFKKYLEGKYNNDTENGLGQQINGLQYSYDLGLLVYTKNVDGDIIQSDTELLMQEIMTEYMGMDMSNMASSFGSNSMFSQMGSNMMAPKMWQEMLTQRDGSPVNDLLKKQYDVVYGEWPNEYDEIVLVLDENNELDDLTLYALGLQSKDKVDAIMDAAFNGTDIKNDEASWSYEDICKTEFRVVLNSSCFNKDKKTGLYNDLRETDAGLQYLYDNALKLKVTGIIRPSEEAQSAMLTGSIAYTKQLTDYVIEQSGKAEVIKAQLKDTTTDVVSGLPFEDTTANLTDTQKRDEFRSYVKGLNTQGKADTYVKIMSIPDNKQLDAMVDNAMKQYNRKQVEQAMIEALSQNMNMDKQKVKDYISEMENSELKELYKESVTEQIKAQYAEGIKQQLAMMTTDQLAATLDASYKGYTKEQCATYYDEVMEFSDTTYEDSLKRLGYVDIEVPSTINIYASSFENKDLIEDAITEYNKGKDELEQIKYTDYVGIMMSSITTIINAITYVLLAFVAISLIVSSIMIGVITLISVQERTKEIGILRAIGASKRDVSSMFNAETIIIGFASGMIGIGVTYLLCIPINIILHALTGIATLNAVLPWKAAVILVAISILLSLFAGLIPSRSAAKKDPVVALRTE